MGLLDHRDEVPLCPDPLAAVKRLCFSLEHHFSKRACDLLLIALVTRAGKSGESVLNRSALLEELC